MTMNRAQRRDLKRRMKRRGHQVVTLRGGPMDGWVVKHDAPALEPDWREKFLEEAAYGAYQVAVDEGNARLPKAEREPALPWDEVPEEMRASFRAMVRQVHGAGRYVLRSPGIDADWKAEA